MIQVSFDENIKLQRLPEVEEEEKKSEPESIEEEEEKIYISSESSDRCSEENQDID